MVRGPGVATGVLGRLSTGVAVGVGSGSVDVAVMGVSGRVSDKAWQGVVT